MTPSRHIITFSVSNCVEIEKTWESLLVVHPSLQAFALPHLKDKQRSRPTSRILSGPGLGHI